MVALVDSRKKQLTIPEILVIAANFQNAGGYPTQAALAMVLKEFELSGRPPVQIGNTVFMETRGKDKTKNILVWRPLNADTPRNFAKNCADYIRRRINGGYDVLVTAYNGDVYDTVVRLTADHLEGDNIPTFSRRTETDTRVMFLRPGFAEQGA